MADLNGPWRWVAMPEGSEVMRDGTHFIRDGDDLVIAKTWGGDRARAIAELPDLLSKLAAIREKAAPLFVHGLGQRADAFLLAALLREIDSPPRAQPEPSGYWDVTP